MVEVPEVPGEGGGGVGWAWGGEGGGEGGSGSHPFGPVTTWRWLLFDSFGASVLTVTRGRQSPQIEGERHFRWHIEPAMSAISAEELPRGGNYGVVEGSTPRRRR